MDTEHIQSIPNIVDMFQDTKIVGMRWDLVPWTLVFDLDVVRSEGKENKHHRAWCAFRNVSDISLDLDEARQPIGIWVDGMSVSEVGNRFVIYAQLASFIDNKEYEFRGSQQLSIKATGAYGLQSTRSALPDEYYCLSYHERQALGSDSDFLAALQALMAKE